MAFYEDLFADEFALLGADDFAVLQLEQPSTSNAFTVFAVLGDKEVAVIDNQVSLQMSMVISTGSTKSQDKIVIGGMPLTLFNDTNGRYSLGVIINNSSNNDSETFMLRGNRFATRNINGTYVPAIYQVPDSFVSSDRIIWQGMPIAINSNSVIMATDASSVIVNEEDYFYVGGLPLVARRSGTDWYLVISVE